MFTSVGSEDSGRRDDQVDQSWRAELSDNIFAEAPVTQEAPVTPPPSCAVVVAGLYRAPTTHDAETTPSHQRYHQPSPSEYSDVRTDSALKLVLWNSCFVCSERISVSNVILLHNGFVFSASVTFQRNDKIISSVKD